MLHCLTRGVVCPPCRTATAGAQEADQGREVVLPDAGRAPRARHPVRLRARRERGHHPASLRAFQGRREYSLTPVTS